MVDHQYDIEFFWDPICPFAWVTSRWIELVAEQKDMTVDWRFIGLRILNEDKDYATEFPPGYPAYHAVGLRALRVAAAVRAEEGRDLMGPLYAALGRGIWHRLPDQTTDMLSGYDEVPATRAALSACGLDERYAEHLDDAGQDEVIRADTQDALSRTGDDLGTPIVSVGGPDGPAFFGPVISRVPTREEAIELWDAVMTLARWPGFAEMKRSLREWPQIPLLTGHLQ